MLEGEKEFENVLLSLQNRFAHCIFEQGDPSPLAFNAKELINWFMSLGYLCRSTKQQGAEVS